MDLSNKALALVLVVATSISLIGTIMSINKLSEINTAYPGAGLVVTQGTTNFTINSSISVVFTISNADFGTGVVASNSTWCVLNTTGSGMLNGGTNLINGPNCTGFNATVRPLQLQNQGTQPVTLNVSFSQNGTQFIGGTVAVPEFGFIFSNNETGANPCGGANTFLSAYKSLNQVNQNTVNYTICNGTSFNSAIGNRTIIMDVGLKIPQDAQPGTRLTTITAFATNP